MARSRHLIAIFALVALGASSTHPSAKTGGASARIDRVARPTGAAPLSPLAGTPSAGRPASVRDVERSVGRAGQADRIPGRAFAPSQQSGSGPVGGQFQTARVAKEVEGELLVRFRPGTSNAARALAHGGADAQRLRTFRVAPNIEHVRLAQGVSVQEAITRYRARPDVVYAEPNYIVEAVQNPQVTPNDPQFGTLWGLHNTGQSGGTPDADIDGPEAWNVATGSGDVVVVVIDTGIDYTHPDLAANIFQNTTDCDADGVDDDANGYTDDCHGIDTANHDSNPIDDNGHGTHTAGTIGAVGNNGVGVVGVNWNVRLLPCKFLGANGSGSTADAIECLDYVKAMKERGANIVATNNSWGGGGYSQALYDAIEAQQQAGILFIAAAGNEALDNDTGTFYPANYDLSNIVSVAATTRTDGRAGFSNYGRRSVHVGAPGQDILSTTPNDTYSVFSGTSMAAPHVSGVAALIEAQDPSHDWRTTRNLILAGGDTIPSLANTVTGKRLNAYGALTCSNSIVTSRLLPAGTFVSATVGMPIRLAALNINCADPNGPVTVTVSPGGSIITLVDDGTSGDQAADDGVYTEQFTPDVAQTYTLSFSTGDSVTVGFPASYNVTATAFDYRTIAGTNLNLFDDTVVPVTPPFPLQFGGLALPTLYVGGNGVMSFSGAIADYFNVPLPDALVQTVVAPFWDDLYPAGSKNVFWDVAGGAPNRELVVEWRDVPTWNCTTGGTVTFQAVFFEASSDIVFNYADTIVGGTCAASDHGGSATVGVQVSPTSATAFSFNAGTLGNQMALLWTPQPVPAAPELNVVPNGRDFGSVEIGGHAEATFSVQNIGGGTLTGSVTTAAPFSILSGGAFSLGPLASQPLVVRFVPTAVGPAAGTMDVASNASNTVVAVTGVGTLPSSSPALLQLQGPNVGTSSIGPVEIPLSAAGGDGTYAWSVVEGSLPPGISLRTDSPSSFPAGASAGLVGVATTPGNYTFTLRVSSAGATVDQVSTIRITGLTIKDGNHFGYLPDAFVGAAYAYTLTALNTAGPVTWTATGGTGLPPGVSLDPSGVLWGTPTASGYYYADVSVTDGVDAASKDLSLTVNALSVTPADGVLPNATQGELYSTTLDATGGTAPYTFTGFPPDGLSLSPSGTISGIVSPFAPVGPWGLYVTITDSNNFSYSRYMSLDVIGVPAKLASIDVYGNFDDCTIGQTCSRGIAVRSGGVAPFTWTATGLPPGVSLRPGTGSNSFVSAGSGWGWSLAAGDGEIWGVPLATGLFDVTVTVTDAEGATTTNMFPLNVSGLAHQPSLSSPTFGVAYTQTVRVIGGTGPYTGAMVAGKLPAGVTFDPATLLLSGTPVETGHFTPVFAFTDADNQTYRVTENLSIDGLSIYSFGSDGNLGTVEAGSTYSSQLSACCAAAYTWSLIDGTLPPGVTLSPDGLLSGIVSTEGSYTFLIRAADSSDGARFGQRQFTLHVSSDPVLTITTGFILPSGNVGIPYAEPFAALGGTGSPAWTLAFGSSLPPGLTFAPNGELSGTPTGTGQFNFTVVAADPGGQVATAPFSLSIYPAGYVPPPSISSGPNFGTWSIGQVETDLRASGGNGAYTWTLVAGALPPGLSIRTDGTSWFPPDASAGIIGVATTTGVYNFTLRVTSGGVSADQDATITITSLAIKDFWELPDAFVDDAYSYTLSAVGNLGPVTWTVTGGLPPGMTLGADGVLSGTPTAAGDYWISLSLSDGVDTVFRGVNLRVSAVQITTAGRLPNATQGAAYNVALTAVGGTGVYTFSASGLPGGFALSPSGTLSSSAVSGGTGQRTFSVTVTDSNNVSYTKNMSIDIIGAVPVLPSITTFGVLADCTIGVACSFTVAVQSGGTAPFTWSAADLPPGLSIRWGSGVTSNYVYPDNVEVWGTATEAGVFNVTVAGTDALGASATLTFPVHVSVLLQTDRLENGTLNLAYETTMRVIGGTGPYTGAVETGRLPAGLALNGANLDVSGTPVESGSFYPLVQFTDAIGNTLRAWNSVFISGEGAAYSTINHNGDLGTVTVNVPVGSTQLSACCQTAYSWALAGGALPPGMGFSVGGLLSGTPTTVGTYSFLVRATSTTDPANIAQRQFTMIVSPLSITTNLTLPFGNVGTPYNQTLTAVGGTGPNTWTVEPGNYLPPGLTLSAGGVLSGTPTASGLFSFAVRVTGSVLIRTFTLAIYPGGAYPPLTWTFGPNLGTYALGTATIQLTSPTTGVPPYHYSLTPGATVIAGMRVQDGQPLPTNFPSTVTGGFVGVATQAGTFSTSIRVTDSLGATVDRAVTMTVVSHHILSQTTLPRAVVGAAYSFNLEPYGGSGAYSWSVTSTPPGLSVNAAGQILGTPTIAGSYSPRVTLTDVATARSISVTYTLSVDPFAINTSGDLPLGKVGTAYSQTLIAPACVSCTWSIVGALPAGLTLSAGAISGTPTSTTSSTSFTVQAAGANGTGQKLFRIQIASATPQPLSVTTTSPLDTTIGAGTANSFLAQGGTPPYVWSLEAGSVPTGLSLQGPGDALGASLSPGVTYLAGRPMQLGVHNFTLRVTDSLGAWTTRAFTWNFSPIGYSYTSLPLTGTALVSGSPYSQHLLALGGTGVYTNWTSTAMPRDLTLDPTTGLVSGQPLDTGTFTVPIQVTDDANTVFRRNVTVTVAGTTPTLVSFGLGATLSAAQLGTTRTYDLSLGGGTAPYTVTALSPLPPGFSLLSGASLLSNGTPGTSYFLSGTPMAAGAFAFTVKATDSVGNIGVRTFTLSVAPFALFSSTTLPDASVGAPYSQPLIAWDNNGSVSWSVSSTSAPLPQGLSLSPGGVLSGTPLAAGNYSFTLNATDPSAVVVSYTFTVRVSNISITSPQVLPFTAISGVPFANYQFTSVGGAGAVTWSASTLPTGVALSPAGVLGGTTTGTGASSTFTVTATDGVFAVSRRFTLFSQLPNPIPLSFALAGTALADAIVGQNVSYPLTATSGNPAYGWNLAPGSTLPPGLSLLAADTFGSPIPASITPGLHTLLAGAPMTAGSYAFDLIASDASGAQIRRTFTLKVTTIGILSGSMRTASAGLAYSQRFIAIGGTAPFSFSMGPVSAVQDMLPPGLNLTADGLVAGTTASSGTYSFVLTVTDAMGATFSRTYSFSVTTASGLTVSNTNPADAWIGGARTQTLTVGGAPAGATYTWSLVSGALPPGMSLVSGPPFASANVTFLGGQPTATGTYLYTLRATDNANPAIFAEHAFTLRVAPHQVTLPARSDLNGVVALPVAETGALYSTTLRAAGGGAPYTFTVSPFTPLPDGLILSADGTLSGAPTISGSFQIAFVVTGADGNTLNGPTTTLLVRQPGVSAPLTAIGNGTLTIDSASRARPYGYALDALVGSGSPPYSWTVAAGSALPAGLTLIEGSNGVSSFLSGAPTTSGTVVFSLVATDFSGQTLTLPISLRVASMAVTPNSLPTGSVGLPYSVPFATTGSSGPYSYQVDPAYDLPGGLTLSEAGVLEGIPTHAGNFVMRIRVASATGATFTPGFEITIDNAAGEAPAVTLSPRAIQVNWTQGTPAPGPEAVSVDATSGAIPFNLSIAGIPGATLAADNGTAPSMVDLTFDVNGLAPGTYSGVMAVRATASANQLDWVGVTLNVSLDTTAPVLSGVPGDLTIEATGPGGAIAMWVDPTATDAVDGVVPVICVPAAGSTVPLGTTPANCTATDAAGNTATGGFNVLVQDTTGPVLTLPTQVIVEATSPLGAMVVYAVSATDAVTGAAVVICAPPSGSLFPIGLTLVACTTEDENENVSSGTFWVEVRDTTAPVVQIATPATDALLATPSVEVVVQATDVVGVTGLTVNGVAATRTAGTALSGTWRATVPVALPVPAGGVLRFDVVASDGASNAGLATRLVDNDGIPSVPALDRGRIDGSDQSDRFSNDINNGVTSATLARNGWTTKVSNGATANAARVQITGTGTTARIVACSGAAKEVRLDVAGEIADVTCNPATGTVTVKAISAVPRVEVWKQTSPTTWTIAQLPAGATYSTGSPATASPQNSAAITVNVVQMDGMGAPIVVGGFVLAPGASVDVSTTPAGPGRDEQMQLRVLRGRVPVTLHGRTRTLTTGEPMTVPIDRTPPRVSCGPADGEWHRANVTIPCVASDEGVGLADAAEVAFTLTTVVADGDETAAAATDTRRICDTVNNCTEIAAIGGYRVDRKAPIITLGHAHAQAVYVLNEAVVAAYDCADAGSGLASCEGTVASGLPIPTTVIGTSTFAATATDRVGHMSQVSTPYAVTYAVVPLDDAPRVITRDGSLSIGVRIEDARGTNQSSAGIVLTAERVTSADGATVLDTERAFRFDPRVGGYRVDLTTTHLPAGTYQLSFRVSGDPIEHSAAFSIR